MADPKKDPGQLAAEAQAQSDQPPDQSVADKVDAAATARDLASTPGVPGLGVPPLAVEPVGAQAADVVGEQPGDDWAQVVFRGAGISGDWQHIPAPPWQDQQIDQIGPSGRSYHFRQNVVALVHPDDAAYFLEHKALSFEEPSADERIS